MHVEVYVYLACFCHLNGTNPGLAVTLVLEFCVAVAVFTLVILNNIRFMIYTCGIMK